MSEKPPLPESAPETDPYTLVEAFAKEGEWSFATEEKFRLLLESNESNRAELYMICLNYRESASLIDELPEHERLLYEWLKEQFKDVPEQNDL